MHFIEIITLFGRALTLVLYVMVTLEKVIVSQGEHGVTCSLENIPNVFLNIKL